MVGGKSWAAAGDESAARRIRMGCILVMIVALVDRFRRIVPTKDA
jgi:hypothetical protein